jgi:tetratricopeptide (TPR) repeat protein
VRYYQEAVELTRKARFAPGLAQSLRFLGEVLQSLGRDGEALPHLREAASLFAQLQDRAAEAGMWARVGQIEERHGPAAEAGAAWSRGLGLARESGDRAGELNALEGLARCARRQEDGPARALAHYREAAALARDLGDGPAEGRLRNTIGILEWERGAYDSALGEYQRALALYEALGDRPSRGLMLNSVGVTLKALGRREEARTCLEQAIAFHREAEQPLLEAHALAALGDLHRESAELSAAERDYRRSLQLRRALGDRRGEGWMLAQLAQLELAQGRADRARDLAGEAAAIAAECGDDALRERCNRPCPA